MPIEINRESIKINISIFERVTNIMRNPIIVCEYYQYYTNKNYKQKMHRITLRHAEVEDHSSMWLLTFYVIVPKRITNSQKLF